MTIQRAPGWYQSASQYLAVSDERPPRAVLGALSALLPDVAFEDSLEFGELPLLYAWHEPTETHGRRWSVRGLVDKAFVFVDASAADAMWDFDSFRDGEDAVSLDAWAAPLRRIQEIEVLQADLLTPQDGGFYVQARWAVMIGQRRVVLGRQRPVSRADGPDLLVAQMRQALAAG